LIGGEASDGRGGEDLDDVDQVDEDAADGEPVAGGLLLVDRAAVVAANGGARVVEEFPDGLAFGAAEELVIEGGARGAAFGFEGVGAEGGGFGDGEAGAEDVRVGADADQVLEDVQVAEVVGAERVAGEGVPVAVVDVRVEGFAFFDVGVILGVGGGGHFGGRGLMDGKTETRREFDLTARLTHLYHYCDAFLPLASIRAPADFQVSHISSATLGA
jgi:hypothetical protein